MAGEFAYLKANEFFAQYWYRESNNGKIVSSIPKRHNYRSIFACDRDRVMYTTAFRRLSSKNQIFTSNVVDTLRTRLTHTLEVSQIARTISRELGLDEDLTEAIALAHDVGHTPFGHVGERTLNSFSIGWDKSQSKNEAEIALQHRGFKHNQQSVRLLVEYSGGVKFTNFTLFGVREHSKLFWKTPDDISFYDIYNPYCSYERDYTQIQAWSFEAFVVKWADEIAQRHHDIEDAFLQKIMSPEEIVEKVKPISNLIFDEKINERLDRLKREESKLERHEYSTVSHPFLHTLASFVVDAYVTVFIKEFKRVLKNFSDEKGIRNAEGFRKLYPDINVECIRTLMRFEDAKIISVDKTIGDGIKYGVVDSEMVQRMDGKGAHIIRKLMRAYISNPQQLPSNYVNRFIKFEMRRMLSPDELNPLIDVIRSKFGNNIGVNTDVWKDYECREALRIINSNEDTKKKVYDSLLRVICDYVAGMTDSYAMSQMRDLY